MVDIVLGYSFYKVERTFEDGTMADDEPLDKNITKELILFKTITETIDYLVEHEKLPKLVMDKPGHYYSQETDDGGCYLTIYVLYYIYPVVMKN